MKTTFHFAKVAEYDELYAASGFYPSPEAGKIGYPTIVARRQDTGELLGFIATKESDTRLQARNLWAPSQPRLAMRLVTAYEAYLSSIGIVNYYFAVRQREQPMYAIAQRLEQYDMARCVASDEATGTTLFVRNIGRRSWAAAM